MIRPPHISFRRRFPTPRRAAAAALLVLGASLLTAVPEALPATKATLTLSSPSQVPPNTRWTLSVTGNAPPRTSLTYLDIFNQSASQACATTVDGEQTQKLQTILDHQPESGSFSLSIHRTSAPAGTLRFCGYLGSNLTYAPPYAASDTTLMVVPGAPGKKHKKHKKPKKCAKKKFAKKHKKKCGK